MISLTEIAARNFKRIREDEELPEDVPLRVSVRVVVVLVMSMY